MGDHHSAEPTEQRGRGFDLLLHLVEQPLRIGFGVGVQGDDVKPRAGDPVATPAGDDAVTRGR